jgi:hypothetical protein
MLLIQNSIPPYEEDAWSFLQNGSFSLEETVALAECQPNFHSASPTLQVDGNKQSTREKPVVVVLDHLSGRELEDLLKSNESRDKAPLQFTLSPVQHRVPGTRVALALDNHCLPAL